jgi:hypothetical protein
MWVATGRSTRGTKGTADAGNDGEAYYQRFGGFCESIGRNDAVQTALWVIESAINDWLRAGLGDHDDASFQKARELCTWILTGIQKATDKRTLKNTLKYSKKSRDYFCDGM